MSNLSRREWHGLVLGGLASSLLPRTALGAGQIDSKVKGVQLGAQSYSFRDRPLEGVIADKFKAAGIDLYAYNYSFRDDYTDAEIERGFDMAKALGAKVITASSNQ